MTWQTVRFNTGMYGVFRRHEGQIVYSAHHKRHEFTDHSAAAAWADKLNGKPTLRGRMTPGGFNLVADHVAMTSKMRSALRLILVDGRTWRYAAEASGVTEPGILRAMRRVAERNHP